MMDVNQAAEAMRDAEMGAEIEDFIEGFNQPTYRGMRVNGLVEPARLERPVKCGNPSIIVVIIFVAAVVQRSAAGLATEGLAELYTYYYAIPGNEGSCVEASMLSAASASRADCLSSTMRLHNTVAMSSTCPRKSLAGSNVRRPYLSSSVKNPGTTVVYRMGITDPVPNRSRKLSLSIFVQMRFG